MIKTTVVGSYPVPTWLQVFSTRESLRDAILAVVKTQELAGIDVVADGELYRWDVNHAETNGMIDFFVRPLDGVNSVLSTEQLAVWRSKPGNQFRAKPPGIVVGPLHAGTLDLKSDYEMYRDLTTKPKKFTVTSPYMLAKMLADQHYDDLEALVMGLADVLKQQLEGIDADVIHIEFDIDLVHFREDSDCSRTGVDAALAFCRRHPLDTMYATFKLHTAKHIGTFDGKGHGLDDIATAFVHF